MMIAVEWNWMFVTISDDYSGLELAVRSSKRCNTLTLHVERDGRDK